ncbi:MAG: helix-turn-helix domain-containing protein [Halobacteria archaeon]|nr:helix-turn-helix domain-containing protein [Halobacteria archaeon]
MSSSGSEEGIDNPLLLEDPELDELLRCIFDIQVHDTETYFVLLENPSSTVTELAERMEKDRSGVNRSLIKLIDKGLAERRDRLLDTGGYVYQYTATPLPEVKDMMHEALDEWVEMMHERIDEFGEE